MSAKKGLGRGFDSLIPTELLDESFDPTAEQDEKVSDLRFIKVSEIVPDKDQPRRSFDELALDDLAESIRQHGVLQPIVVTPKNGKYLIVAGERRYRASLLAEQEKIPALVRTLTNQHRLELSLIENLQRSDLNPMEVATAYLKLRDQFNMTLEQISERVGGKSISTISNRLRLLRLPSVVQQLLTEHKITEGQARPLIGLDEKMVEVIVPRILKEEWSARKIEQYIVELKRSDAMAAPQKAKKLLPAAYQQQTSRLSKKFASEVSIKASAKGSGQIIFRFKNKQDFERLNSLLG